MRTWIFFVVVVGCGGIALTNNDGGHDAPSPSGCPSSESGSGSACSTEGLQCEYGTGDRWTCNDIVKCSSGSWSITSSTSECSANSSGCPPTMTDATGSCSDRGLACDYSTAAVTKFCTCGISGGPIQPDGGVYWACVPTQSGGCPAARPRIGETCSQAGLQCSYDICGVPSGLSFECSATTSTWVEGPAEFCG